MSAYTALKVTRSKARAKLVEFIMYATDSELEQLLSKMLRERLYYAIIVDDSDENDDGVL